MTLLRPKYLFLALFGVAAWLGTSPTGLYRGEGLLQVAEAVRGRPATPVSYAGVARRTTVRVATPGVGAGGVGGPASGVGVRPGVGAGAAGVGYSGGAGANLGGPVNRVGVR